MAAQQVFVALQCFDCSMMQVKDGLNRSVALSVVAACL